MAATPVRDTSTRPSGRISSTYWSILARRARQLEHEALGRGVDHPCPEGVAEPQRLGPVLAAAPHLDHGELALDERLLDRQVVDLVHGNEPLELVADLLDGLARARGHDGNAGQVLGMRHFGNRETLDIVAAAREQADHAGQDAGLVVDQHRERVGLGVRGDGGRRIG